MMVIDLAEARRTKRNPALDMALIRAGRMSCTCIVYNLSDAGAALDVGPQGAIPDQFDLVVLPKTKTYSCHVVWRANGRIGVSFR
jgi:hypothetical protein